MQNKLVFSSDGKSVHIEFKNGKESLEFYSKEEALIAIRDCYNINKITESEKSLFIKDIVLSDLPEDVVSFAIAMVLISLFEGAAAIAITDPYVEICTCGVKIPHAYIHNGDGTKIGPPFRFKNEGYGFVKKIQLSGAISQGDVARLNTLIDVLPLPEDPSLN